jgi:hypothetical protein
VRKGVTADGLATLFEQASVDRSVSLRPREHGVLRRAPFVDPGQQDDNRILRDHKIQDASLPADAAAFKWHHLCCAGLLLVAQGGGACQRAHLSPFISHLTRSEAAHAQTHVP